MKILHVITLADLGGAQSVLLALCNRAAANGHDVCVASEASGPMWEQLNKNIRQYRISSLRRDISAQNDFKTLLALKKISKEAAPDIVHLHSSKIGFLGRLAFPKNKIIYTVHGFDSIRIANRKFLFLEKLLKNRARYIVGVSRYDLENLAAEGITENVQVIYNGVTDGAADFPAPSDKYAWQILEKLSQEKTVIMTIARLSPPKDFELFCKIAAVFASDTAYHFVWIGNRKDQEIQRPNLSMLGELSCASQYLKFADIFLLPSRFEGLPISILEALSHSVPAVASEVGGISEVLNGKNGFAVPNTAEDFTKAIGDVLANSELYKTFQVQARQTFEAHFTLDFMYKSYFDLYKKIAEDKVK